MKDFNSHVLAGEGKDFNPGPAIAAINPRRGAPVLNVITLPIIQIQKVRLYAGGATSASRSVTARVDPQ